MSGSTFDALLLALADRLVPEDGEGQAHPSAVLSGDPSRARVAIVSCSFSVISSTVQEGSAPCPRTTTMTVRVSGALSEFVATNVGEDGAYENVREYIRDLIRRDKDRVKGEAFDRLKAELNRAFSAPEESYEPVTAAEVIARNGT